MRIQFNKPFIVGAELNNIARAVLVKGVTSGDGDFTRLCQAWLEDNLGCGKALLTHSCTAALEMAAILCGVGPGDEVIMPSFTFVSTANAFVLRGATPVFIDIRPDTLNIDEQLIPKAITERTKTIVPVHYAGIPCAMDEICDIALGKELLVVEDAAQALLSDYDDKKLGALGDLGCLSFHETKNIISGEGGALLINNDQFIERAEIIWQKGTNRKNFERGVVNKYTWVDIGSSFLPSEITAAFLYAQMNHAEEIITRRRYLCSLYIERLALLYNTGHICHPPIHNGNGHIFYVLTNTSDEKTKLLSHLNNNGINAVFHYVPLHSSPAGRKYGRVSGSMNVTDDISSRIIRLPIYYEMKEQDIDMVTEEIFSFYGTR